jgi:hypothetical protein
MALPPQLRPSPTPQELEYITGEYIVSIEPLFRMERIRLVSVSELLQPVCASERA